jgi:hypothetical protein
MKISATSCLLALLCFTGTSRADDQTAPAANPPAATAAPTDSDSAQAINEAREQLIEAQRMADAALQAAATRDASSSASSSSSSTTTQSASDSSSSSSASTHHTIGEVVAFHLGPDYSDSHHHSMGSLAP